MSDRPMQPVATVRLRYQSMPGAEQMQVILPRHQDAKFRQCLRQFVPGVGMVSVDVDWTQPEPSEYQLEIERLRAEIAEMQAIAEDDDPLDY